MCFIYFSFGVIFLVTAGENNLSIKEVTSLQPRASPGLPFPRWLFRGVFWRRRSWPWKSTPRSPPPSYCSRCSSCCSTSLVWRRSHPAAYSSQKPPVPTGSRGDFLLPARSTFSLPWRPSSLRWHAQNLVNAFASLLQVKNNFNRKCVSVSKKKNRIRELEIISKLAKESCRNPREPQAARRLSRYSVQWRWQAAS